jgi:hypothetical protein
MTSERYASTRALDGAVNGRETGMLKATEAPGRSWALGGPHWRWRVEVAE